MSLKERINDSNIISDLNDDWQCALLIKGVAVKPSNIKSLVIREWIFDTLPTLEVIMMDTGTFVDAFPLEDGDLIQVEVNRDQKNEKDPPISMEFTLQDFEFESVDIERVQTVVMRLTAIAKTENMFVPIYNRSFKKSSSVQALTKIAKECSLETNAKISTNDVMTWLQINQNNYDMIHHLRDRAYKEKNDAVFVCMDRENEFIITSLKTELENKESTKIIFDPKKVFDVSEKKAPQPDDKEDKDIYFNKYKYINIAGNINKVLGYGIEYDFYALTGEEKKNTLDSDEHSLTDLSFKNKNYSGKIVKHFNKGIKFSADNTYDYYLVALMQNEYIKNSFFASNLILYINTTDKIRLFSKIELSIPSMIPASEEEEDINEVFSGEYIVGGILHQISSGGTYKMVLSCFRNGINESSISDGETNLTKENKSGVPILKLPSLPSLPF